MIKIIFKIFLLLLIIAIVAAGIFLYKKQRQAEAKIMGMTPANVSEKVIYFLPQQGNPKRKLRLEIPKILRTPTIGYEDSYLSIGDIPIVILETVLKKDWERAILLRREQFYGSAKDPKFLVENSISVYFHFYSSDSFSKIKEEVVIDKSEKFSLTKLGNFVRYTNGNKAQIFFKNGVTANFLIDPLNSEYKISRIESLYYSFNPIIVEDN